MISFYKNKTNKKRSKTTTGYDFWKMYRVYRVKRGVDGPLKASSALPYYLVHLYGIPCHGEGLQEMFLCPYIAPFTTYKP